MNTTDGRVEASLPALSDARIDRIEDAVFDAIGRERSADIRRRARRGRLWMGGAAAAAVIAVAVIAAPFVVPFVTGGAATSEAYDLGGIAVESADDMAGDMASEEGAALADGAETTAPDRDIVTTASATVVVPDSAVAARTIGDAAVARGGYVESMNIDTTSSTSMTADDGVAFDSMPYPYPYPGGGAWITVRVPADELPELMQTVGDVGEVTASSTSRQDVTQQSVDLEARVEAAEASVERLTALMAEAEDVSDLIAAEAALSERQAMLESYRQQLEILDDQVAMSTLTVSLVEEGEPIEADPAGFTDGLAAGWNGLVATLNGIVIALGFLIPWVAVVGVVALIVWGVIRMRRRRRSAGPPEAASDED